MTDTLVGELAEARTARARQVSELAAIVTRNEGRDAMPEGDAKRYGDINRALDKADRAIAELEAKAASAQERQARQARAAQLGIGPASTSTPGRPPAVRSTREFQVNRALRTDDIYDRSGLNVGNPADGMAFRDRALRAIESWRVPADRKESAAALIDNPKSLRDRQIADLHILGAGSPTYIDAFHRYLAGEDPRALPQEFREVNARAMTEQTIAAGQALVPPILDPSITLTGNGAQSPFRALCDVRTITTQTWRSIASPDFTAEWAGESTQASELSGNFTQLSLTPVRADAYLPISVELLEDAPDAIADMEMLFADARNILESTSFVSGTGSTQPQGLTTFLDTQTASRTASQTTGQFGLVDVFAAVGNLPPRFRPGAAWLANDLTWNRLRQTSVGTLLDSSPWREFADDSPPKLAGKPAWSSSGMLNSQTTGSDIAVVGDFRAGARIVDRAGTAVIVQSLTGTSGRLTQQRTVYVAWRSTFAVVAAGAFQMVRI